MESKNNLKIEIKLYEGEANTFYVMLKCQKKFVVLLVINNINWSWSYKGWELLSASIFRRM